MPYQSVYLHWFDPGGDSVMPMSRVIRTRAAPRTVPRSGGSGSWPPYSSHASLIRMIAVSSIACSPACGSPPGITIERNVLKVVLPSQPVSSMCCCRCTPATPLSPTAPPGLPCANPSL
jgi:hypothetical protein